MGQPNPDHNVERYLDHDVGALVDVNFGGHGCDRDDGICRKKASSGVRFDLISTHPLQTWTNIVSEWFRRWSDFVDTQ